MFPIHVHSHTLVHLSKEREIQENSNCAMEKCLKNTLTPGKEKMGKGKLILSSYQLDFHL